MTDPRLARPSWRGRTNVDALTIAALEKAEKIAGRTFTITQGSYQSSVAQSAGTHDGGGAIDLAWTGRAADVRALRLAGFAAWHRTPAQGDWKDHIHAVLVGHPLLSPSAARQVTAYRSGLNGLANGHPDDGPRITPIPTFVWEDDDMAQHAQQLNRIEAAVKALAAEEAKRWRLIENRHINTTTRLKRLIAQGQASKADLQAVLAELDG